jgi:hypothetical protein
LESYTHADWESRPSSLQRSNTSISYHLGKYIYYTNLNLGKGMNGNSFQNVISLSKF